MIPILAFLVILIILIEGIPLFRGKKWPELVTAGVLIGIGLLVGLSKILGVPTPIEILTQMLYPIGKTIFKHF